jgi:hypothetical protein
MQHARQRIRDLTARSRLLLPVEVIVADVNRFLPAFSHHCQARSARDPFTVSSTLEGALHSLLSERRSPPVAPEKAGCQ